MTTSDNQIFEAIKRAARRTLPHLPSPLTNQFLKNSSLAISGEFLINERGPATFAETLKIPNDSSVDSVRLEKDYPGITVIQELVKSETEQPKENQKTTVSQQPQRRLVEKFDPKIKDNQRDFKLNNDEYGNCSDGSNVFKKLLATNPDKAETVRSTGVDTMAAPPGSSRFRREFGNRLRVNTKLESSKKPSFREVSTAYKYREVIQEEDCAQEGHITEPGFAKKLDRTATSDPKGGGKALVHAGACAAKNKTNENSAVKQLEDIYGNIDDHAVDTPQITQFDTAAAAKKLQGGSKATQENSPDRPRKAQRQARQQFLPASWKPCPQPEPKKPRKAKPTSVVETHAAAIATWQQIKNNFDKLQGGERSTV